jgi:asparagine synthase (glutamine-hydrolysing)
MCGLFGYFSKDPACDRVALKGRLMAAQAALHHRGPDDRGLELFSIPQGNNLPPFELTFGHTRLSIIDLSSSGHQPMHSGDVRYVIVYNGEIYNYKELRNELKDLGHAFNTQSDTEVLIAAWSQWGPESLKKLIGMFAFAIFDKINQTLTLARDAFGIKPLFYRNDENGIYFASELTALIKLIQKK